MAHCPKCGRGNLIRPKGGGPKSCRHCGTIRQLILPVQPSYAISDSDWLKARGG